MPAPSPERLLAAMPYAAGLGIELGDATPERTTGSLAWAPERCTTGGLLHGGALMSLADTIGAICAFLNLPADASTATVTSTTTFFRAMRQGMAHATARPLHAGRSFVTVQTDVTDDEGRPIVQTVQTQAVITPRA